MFVINHYLIVVFNFLMQKTFTSFRTKPGEFILHMVGLPFEATPRTVKEFLYPAKVKDSDIKLMTKTDGSGRCSGNAFAKVIANCDHNEFVS